MAPKMHVDSFVASPAIDDMMPIRWLAAMSTSDETSSSSTDGQHRPTGSTSPTWSSSPGIPSPVVSTVPSTAISCAITDYSIGKHTMTTRRILRALAKQTLASKSVNGKARDWEANKSASHALTSNLIWLKGKKKMMKVVKHLFHDHRFLRPDLIRASIVFMVCASLFPFEAPC